VAESNGRTIALVSSHANRWRRGCRCVNLSRHGRTNAAREKGTGCVNISSASPSPRTVVAPARHSNIYPSFLSFAPGRRSRRPIRVLSHTWRYQSADISHPISSPCRDKELPFGDGPTRALGGGTSPRHSLIWPRRKNQVKERRRTSLDGDVDRFKLSAGVDGHPRLPLPHTRGALRRPADC
jgi:hypothetical protein